MTNSNLFHCFSSLEGETVKQPDILRNSPRNSDETKSLECLLILPSKRNTTRNIHETNPKNDVSSSAYQVKQQPN